MGSGQQFDGAYLLSYTRIMRTKQINPYATHRSTGVCRREAANPYTRGSPMLANMPLRYRYGKAPLSPVSASPMAI